MSEPTEEDVLEAMLHAAEEAKKRLPQQDHVKPQKAYAVAYLEDEKGYEQVSEKLSDILHEYDADLWSAFDWHDTPKLPAEIQMSDFQVEQLREIVDRQA